MFACCLTIVSPRREDYWGVLGRRRSVWRGPTEEQKILGKTAGVDAEPLTDSANALPFQLMGVTYGCFQKIGVTQKMDGY